MNTNESTITRLSHYAVMKAAQEIFLRRKIDWRSSTNEEKEAAYEEMAKTIAENPERFHGRFDEEGWGDVEVGQRVEHRLQNFLPAGVEVVLVSRCGDFDHWKPDSGAACVADHALMKLYRGHAYIATRCHCGRAEKFTHAHESGFGFIEIDGDEVKAFLKR